LHVVRGGPKWQQDELLKIEGVVAVGEFRPDGSLVDYKASTDMTPEPAAMSAQFCSSGTQLFNTLAGSFARLSKMSWTPQLRLAYPSSDWTVAVGGNKGVFIETAKADFNHLFSELVGSR
jgi:roadblock/LC7 domain-containing protein